MKMTIRVVNEIKTGGASRKIVRDEQGRFWSIESDDIQNGRLIKAYNGLQGLVSDTQEECETRTRQELKFRYLTKEKGMSIEEAIKEVFRL